MNKLSALLVLVGVVISVVLVGFVLSHRPGNKPEADAEAAIAEPATAADEDTNHAALVTHRTGPQEPQSPSNEGPVEMPATGTNLMTGWEDKVQEILGSTGPDADKAKQMLELFPSLTADGQEEVARHLTNLLPDQDYGLMHGYLTNASLPEGVLDILLNDVLNRPNSLKLPALLEVARNAHHPKAAEAMDFLKLFLEEDYATDWDKWQAGVDQWLKANPD